jgi:outer membrane autotransporter protein
LGIGNDGSGTQPLNVYLATPASGNYTVVVSNNGSTTTDKNMTAGVGSLDANAVTNIYGPATIQVTGTGAGSGKAMTETMGIGVRTGTVTTEATTISVSATGGIDTNFATAEAKGITAGGEATVATVNVGTTTGTNTFRVTAQGGYASGDDSNTGNVGAKAFGVENYENSTVNLLGTTNISVSATGGRPLGTGNIANISTADTYGIYNSIGSVNADKLVLTSIAANGDTGQYTQGTAIGIYNRDGGAVTINNLTITELVAKGGQAGTGGYANANAYGIQSDTGSVIVTDAFDINVKAQGGTSDNEAPASAAGIINGDTIDNGASLTMGKTGGSNTVMVTAIGGYSSGLDENNNMSAEAMGLYNNAATTLYGATTFAVESTGGQKFEAGNIVGNSSAKAFGIYNQGASLTTEDLTFTKVYATGKTGADTYAEAYGIYNTDNNATLSFGNLTFTDVQANGGNSSDSGSNYARAAAIWAESGNLVAGNIMGTVTATAGSGPGGNAEAYGITSGATAITATSLNLNVTAKGGASPVQATATAKALETNQNLITVTGGPNQLKAEAYGGKSYSTDETGDVSATAYGIYNSNQVNMQGATTFTVKATGGSPGSASEPPNYMAGDAYAEAYGIYNEGQSLEMGDLTFTEISAQGGTGSNAAANVYGIYNTNSESTFSVGSIIGTTVIATGGSSLSDASARAYGIMNSDGTLETTSTSADNSLNVVAKGGTILGNSEGNKDIYAEAYGIRNENSARTILRGNWVINVQATGGTAGAGITDANGSAMSAGVFNESYQGVTLAGPVTINATAVESVGSSSEGVRAGGIYSANGAVELQDAVNITTAVTSVSGAEFMAAALYANNGIINAGTDGTSSLGKLVKLQGDVVATGDNGIVNLTLDQGESYLQGNVRALENGQVNLVVAKGAAWKPVYDNRYGSFYDEAVAETHSQSYTVTDNAITNLNLSEGGIVDLTWDNRERDPYTAARTLTISNLSGNNGIFKINSNLAQNIADQITVDNISNDVNTVGIDVRYDPYLVTAGLTKDSNIKGSALVLKGAGVANLTTVNGIADSYNMYEYMPTITKNADDTYSLTALTITNGTTPTTPTEPTTPTTPTTPTNPSNDKINITAPSRPMREALHDRMAVHNLWVNGELNNMQKRMGDLRTAQPAESGIWARYEYNKLEKGSDSNLKYNLFQLGYDKDYVGNTGTFYRGAAFSYAKGNGTYEISTGDLKEGALSLYQTWIGKDGRYYDVILKGGKLMSNYEITNTANLSKADYSTWAYSLSGEVGKRFKKANGFYVEPQLELTLGRINGADYTTSTGMNVDVSGQNIALARIGVGLGQEVKNGNYYFKANYYHDFGGGLNLTASDNTTNPYSYGENIAKNWAVLTLGGNMKAGKNCNIYGELSKYVGQLTNNIQINVGARWSF